MPVTPDPPLLHEDPDVHRRRWLLLGVMCLSLVLVVMAVSSLNVAAPRLQQDLGASATELHWIIDSYALVFAGLLLAAGALGDRFGRKGALLAGLAVFGVGLVVSGLGDSASQVIAGRAIMGVGSAFVMPATLSLITAVFPPEERMRAIATWAGFAGAGGAIGPVVAGALLEEFWWGSAVLVNLPVVAIAFVAVAVWSPRSRDSHVTPLDPAGSVLALLAMTTLLYGIIEGAERGWTDGLVLGAFAAAVVFGSAFVAWEARAAHPMLPLSLFRDRRFNVASGAITFTFFVMFGWFFLATLYLQYALGYSPLEAGLASLPMAGAMVAVSPRSAGFSERFGNARVIAVGFGLMALALALFTQVTTTTPYPVLAVGMVLFGMGLASTAAPATSMLMAAVPLDKAGVGSAVNDTTREFGGALGIAVFGSVAGSAYRSGADLAAAGASDGASEQAVESAGESIGAAWGIAQGLPGGGEAMLAEAQSAFVDAFRLTNALSLAVAIAAGAFVWVSLRGSRADAPVTEDELATADVAEPRPAEVGVDAPADAGVEVPALAAQEVP
jgi:EmrB/QacA subfamily drug resistance transporter